MSINIDNRFNSFLGYVRPLGGIHFSGIPLWSVAVEDMGAPHCPEALAYWHSREDQLMLDLVGCLDSERL